MNYKREKRANKMMKGNSILVGWASRDITPAKPVALVGQYEKRISEYVRDPITVTALAIESVDESKKVIDQAVMVSCDLLVITKDVQDKVRKKMKLQIPDLDPEKTFLNATHIHTGPYLSRKGFGKFGGKVWEAPPVTEGVMAPEEYADFLVGRLCEAAVEAWNSRRPGGVSWKLGHAVIGHNRRVVYDDGTAKMYGLTDTVHFVCLEGPSDHGVEMLFFWNRKKELTGMIINLACASQVVEHKSYISADFWGEVRKKLKERYKKNIFVFAMTGAAGDQSPRDLVRHGIGEKDMYNESGMEEVATRIVDAVECKLEEAKRDIRTDVIFRHSVKNIDLPLWRVTKEEVEKARKEYERIVKKYQFNEEWSQLKDLETSDKMILSQVIGLQERYEDLQRNPFYNMEIHAIRIGDVAIATNPFELFIEYGLQIKARSKAQQTFIAQLACDYGGYLPTSNAVSGGGYSAHVSNGYVGPEGGRLLVEYTVKFINELWEKSVL